ncbi:ABC transporter ATP-binding protein [Mycoplasmopsis gallopavonis]|uniref:ABC-type multidrug/protein/lipid transport system ATPase component n=1 Tax=Mycoplasmopsis gallopavonis TaxID=76629 RepID=A0A449B0K1_9BACT|nr:ABC transporter ATP-binding protein [Mycoplasmopsis gallopavonis]RIV16771.1 ABC transporter ATP-binding protein [Mycoplasmopsis gallopavonis]VEU73266.1 ABC-type multidrug/protein/lipid transport system ATPase component [Mycoplasmopsis gallopavonis]
MPRVNLTNKPEKINFNQIKKLFKLVPFKIKHWIFLILFVLATTGLGAFSSWLIGFIISQNFSQATFQNWQTNKMFYFLLVGILLVVYALSRLISIFNNLIVSTTFNKYSFELREQIYLKIQTLSMNFFENEKTGDLMTIVVSDTQNLTDAISNIITNILNVIFTFTITITLMFIYAPILAIIALVLVPSSGIVFIWIISKTKQNFKIAQDAAGSYNGYVEEILKTLPNIRLHNQRAEVIKKFEEVSLLERNAGRKAVLYWHILFPTYNLINILNQLIIVSLGTYFLLNKISTYGVVPLDFGIITSFSMYIATLTNQIKTVLGFTNSLQSGLASWERIERILNLQDKNPDLGHFDLDYKEGLIEFQNVSFAYPNNPDKIILKNINFTIPASTTLALVGHTGCGKTTISKLLAKFYEPQNGNILIDKQNSKSIKQASWREYIGTISQDTFLFEDTLLNNLKVANNEISEEEIFEICKITQIDKFIQNLPNGYQTILNNNGSNISEGQRQLLAITRAIISKKPIIIMDEATAKIDTITEKLIQEAMNYLMANRTLLVIAHRLSTIMHAEQIIVMENGRILEQGNHQTLLNNPQSKYAELYNAGFKE